MVIQQIYGQIHYDQDLQIEAYNLSGVVQKFPNHFHDYYVIGILYKGARQLWCKGKEYLVKQGDLILFNPKDNHYCSPVQEQAMDYQAINICVDVMKSAVEEITGTSHCPQFTKNILQQSGISSIVKDLYQAIVGYAPKLLKEEIFYHLVEQVLEQCVSPFTNSKTVIANEEIQWLCQYIEAHFPENITLDELCAKTHFSKYHMLHAFTREVGVSPYRYLQSVRINKAKKKLEQNISLVDVALQCGFTDQSHFTNYFKSFIGVTPKQYQKIFTKTSTQEGEGSKR